MSGIFFNVITTCVLFIIALEYYIKMESLGESNITTTIITYSHDISQIRNIQSDFLENPNRPQIGDIFQHYKGGFYQIKGITMEEKSETIMITYNGITNENIMPIDWSRSYEAWKQEIDGVPRFKKVENGFPFHEKLRTLDSAGLHHTFLAPTENVKGE
jgi:hypothetical protein